MFMERVRGPKECLYNRSIVTDNYLPPFSKDLFRLLANCFQPLGCVNIPDAIG